MSPPIAPIGLEYVAAAALAAGIEVDILDLCWVENVATTLDHYFSQHHPTLVGLSFRNVDDCFWPSCQSFVSALVEQVQALKKRTAAPIVLGGIGFSIFSEQLANETGVDYGIRGDGEAAIVALYQHLHSQTCLEQIPGLVWHQHEQLRANHPAWPDTVIIRCSRNLVDNRRYFQLGGQIGLETKRGCPRGCLYCADPVAKGQRSRLCDPRLVADEAVALLSQGIDVLHTCDAEFNLPLNHAKAICREFIQRDLGNKLCWYAYLSIVPFDLELATLMKQAGCVGVDFTTDAACPEMLKTYGQPYDKKAITQAITLCREQDLIVMLDLLTAGPGETPETLAETIHFMKQTQAHGIGTGVGIRIYPGTGMVPLVDTQGPWETNPNIKRKYDGPIDLLQPTFYISEHLGSHPARLIKELIDGDPRFFEPMEEAEPTGGHADSMDHNYNDNSDLADAIAQGQRGAYWHLMLQQRGLV